MFGVAGFGRGLGLIGRIVLRAVTVEFLDGLEGTVIGALGGGFVAAEDFEGVVAGGIFEGESDAAIFIHVLIMAVNVVFVIIDFEVEEGNFDGIDAHDLPHVGGEESDEVEFEFVDGGVAGEVGVEVLGVAVGVFVDEGHGGGAEAMGDAVGAGVELAFGGCGARGFGSVGAGGGGLGGGGWTFVGGGHFGLSGVALLSI